MLARDSVSYAPIPSTDRIVWVGLLSAAAVRACTIASVPALVDSANWWGLHAVWIWGA